MEILKAIIQTYGTQLIGLIMAAICGSLGMMVKHLLTRWANSDEKVEVAKAAAKFVEQCWKNIHGPEKLEKALEVAEMLLKKKGIDWDAEEMKILIEAAVAEFNEAFKKPTVKEDTAEAARCVDQEKIE